MKTILLLEDLPEIRAWLRKLVLEVFPGAHLSESARVHDAIELVGAIKFDLALIDLGLPDGSGVDVVTKLRDLQPEAQSVVVTIHDDDEHLFPALIESMAGSDAICLRQMVDGLTADHRTLEACWQHLRGVLERIAAGECVPLLADAVEVLAACHERHMEREERELLPMAARLLSDEDLARLEHAMRGRR